MRAIIFAAGKASRLGQLTKELPKICLKLDSQETILSRNLKLLAKKGFKELIIVVGHAENKIKKAIDSGLGKFFDKVELIYNKHYHDRNNIYTAFIALEYIKHQTLVLNSDIVFAESILEDAVTELKHKDQSFMLIDNSKKLVDEDMKVTINDAMQITRVNKALCNESSYGEFTGMMHLNIKDLAVFKSSIDKLLNAKEFDKYYEDAIDQASESMSIKALSTNAAPWTEIDTPEDYELACKIFVEHLQCAQ